MKEYPIISKKSIRANKTIKTIQKQEKKKYKRTKGKFPKSCIPNIVMCTGYHDLVGEQSDNPKEVSVANLLDAIEASGLKGRSGNGFPVYKKIEAILQTSSSGRILLVNGVECDPGLVHDEWLLQNHLEQIVEGIKLVSQIIGADESILAVKQPDLLVEDGIRVVTVPDRYPIGEEHVLINHVLGRSFDKNVVPANEGILVMNLQTILAVLQIYEGVFQDDCRYITIADYTCGEAVVAKVKIGMQASDVLNRIYQKQPDKSAYAGTGVMHAHEIEENEVITASTNLVGYGQVMSYSNDNRCKKCGACVRSCPAKIKVKDIVVLKEKDPLSVIDEDMLNLCLKCGTCTFSCKADKYVMNYVAE